MTRRLAIALIAVAALALPGVAYGDVVTDWNRTMRDALYATHTPPPPSMRIGAIVQTSVFDAVNGIAHRYEQFHPEVLNASAPPGASRRAAAASAAYTALSALLPSQQAAFDAQYAATLASLPTSASVDRGLAWGRTVADAILAWRSSDGFTTVLPLYVVGPLPSWQPTPPGFAATPAFRQFASMAPWTMTSPGQFLPPPPPSVTSARYTADFQEVKTIGNAATATPADVETARFWNGQFDTPVTIWNRVGESLLASRHPRLVDRARFYALLNVSMADAVIAIWNAKNAYNTWRPVTAIRNADADGNPATGQDATWTPVLTTPVFQEYPSGHSGVSSAAAAVLASFFGDRTTFTVTSDGLPPAPSTARTYGSFSDAIADVAQARVAAGIHFRFSCNVASQMGAGVARQAIDTEMQRLHSHKG
jgi:membrane-associated phospholipid phosphatase